MHPRSVRWILILMMMSVIPSGVFGRELLEGIMIRVNDDMMTVSEFKSRLSQELAQTRPKPEGAELEKYAESLADNLVNEMILIQRAQEKGITVDDQMIDEAIKGLREENNLQDEETFIKALEESGLTEETLRERYRRNFMMSRAAQSEIKPTEITTEELRQFYEKHKERYAVPEKFHLEQIIFPVAEDGKDVEQVVQRAQAMIDRVRKGADLKAEATLAGVKVQDLGEIPAADLRPELVELLNAQKEGEFTDPLKTPGGIQLLRVVKRIPATYTPFEEVEKEIRREEVQRIFLEQQKGMIDTLKKEYLVEIHREYIPGILKGGSLDE